MSVQGTVDPKFEPVRDALAALLASGKDIGASAAVTVNGELVADVWGGFTNEEQTTPWEADTIVNVYSTTKTMTNLSALLLADRGELDVDAPVATYWPEFKANGKENVLVRHLLSHTSGLSGWEEPLTPDDLYDWDKCVNALAAQAPWWEPGTASGYHAITQGYLVGEVVRRISGVSLGTFFAREIAGPLGADFHIGTGPEADDRVAWLLRPPVIDADAMAAVAAASGADPEILRKTFGNPIIDASVSREVPWRRAEIPAANGHGNARSVAMVQALVSNHGEAGGKRLLSEAGVQTIFREQSNANDLVMGVPIRFGIGYGLPGELIPLPSPNSCYWGGYGGSIVINDLDTRMTVAYVMNRMGETTTGDERGASIAMAAYQSLLAS
jgi:CubicO group peptidase (beta-lactamase class C family)